jgi:NTE family protein
MPKHQPKRRPTRRRAPTPHRAPALDATPPELDHARLKTGRRGARPPFECITLILQGGGALGAYQGGVYQALAEAQLLPNWVAGISIGSINAALIAGNAPEKRVERLREFWEAISHSPFGLPELAWLKLGSEFTHRLANQLSALAVLFGGAPGFFALRLPPPYVVPTSEPGALSFYDVKPLKATLERLIDFDRINAGEIRLSLGTVNVKTGNFCYFDTTTHKILPEHVIASGSLPPGFPATEIDGEHYWDGGIVSNAPLHWVLENRPRKDMLVFQVDLWNARGELPRNLMEVDLRQKEIRFSSRTRMATDNFRKMQLLRRAGAKLLAQLPQELRRTPEAEMLAGHVDEKVYNIIQLIYHAQNYEGTSKDYEFSRRTMEEHWRAGYADAVPTLNHPEVLERPKSLDGVFTFDLAGERAK